MLAFTHGSGLVRYAYCALGDGAQRSLDHILGAEIPEERKFASLEESFESPFSLGIRQVLDRVAQSGTRHPRVMALQEVNQCGS
jgi:hypothetical protein